MAVHNEGIVCTGCNAKLLQAIPYLREWFQARKRENPKLHVSWSWRGEADQNEAYRNRASRCQWPNSAHNKTDAKGRPESHALDLFEMVNGRATYPHDVFARIAAESEEAEAPIIWGGDFRGLGDACHFEYSPGSQKNAA